MNIAIVSHCSLTDNSGVQIGKLAQELATFGVDCSVLTPQNPDISAEHGFAVRPFGSCRLGFADGRGPDLVHAWTPREPVRRQTELLASRHLCPFIVHLEDNEEVILKDAMSPNRRFLREIALLLSGASIVPITLTHPKRGASFLRRASGITLLTERLKEFAPGSVPTQMFWPGYDPAFTCLPVRGPSRRELDLTEDEIAIVYTGNFHASNMSDIRMLYAAIATARGAGLPVRLIRTGKGSLSGRERAVNDGIIDLGFVKREQLPALYAAADLFVQPGKADTFNGYRFPSKIPDMLVSGRLVVLPRANIGLHLQDGHDALLLDDGNPNTIVDKIIWFSQNRQTAREIGRRGREFALDRLTWHGAAAALKQFYRDTLVARSAIAPERQR